MMRLVFGDVGLKVVALLIAWSMWFLVREGLDQDITVKLPVKFETPADILAERVSGFRAVKVRLRGSRAEVARFRELTDRSVTVRIDADSFADDLRLAQRTFTYDSPSVVFPGPIQAKVLRVQGYDPPEGIKCTIWRIEEFDRPIETPRIEEGSFGSDAEVKFRRMLQSNARVRGKSEELKDLRAIPTVITAQALESAWRELGTKSGDVLIVPVQVDKDHQDGSIEFQILDPANGMRAEVRIERTHTEPFEVPVEIYYKDAGSRRLRAAEKNKLALPDVYVHGDPPRLKLELRGDKPTLRALDPASISIHVQAWDWKPENQTEAVQVQITLPEGVELAGKAAAYKLFLEPAD